MSHNAQPQPSPQRRAATPPPGKRTTGGSQGKNPLPQREVDVLELHVILERVRAALSPDEYDKLCGVVDTLAFLTVELEAKGASIRRLRAMLFGASTEKTRRVLGGTDSECGEGADPKACEIGDDSPSADKNPEPPASAGGESSDDKQGAPPKRKGHGRKGAAAYVGAEKVKVPHPSVHIGDCCPECQRGTIYALPEPRSLVRVKSMGPFVATVYECDRLRCSACQEVFSAPAPAGVGEEKYDETVPSMIGLLRYGAGLPFNRIEQLQHHMEIPLPATTQWDLVADGADKMEPAHDELVRQAAQGNVVHNDDTGGKVLALMGEHRADVGDHRTGVFTTGIVSQTADHRIALFFTGTKHAGENLEEVLGERLAKLPPPIQMCDALSRNAPGDLATIEANCLTHARRNFVEVVDSFPQECEFVITTLREVYRFDALAREQQMTDQERLRFHQVNSGPLMGKLKRWMRCKLKNKEVEPNSGLGEAIRYMLKHWRALILFLIVAGAPLDNNVCERALKKAIMHRKNSLFYKTLNGARVGDMYMSLIHTAELNSINPFDYLVELLRHHKDVAVNSKAWMPWNYQATLAEMKAVAPSSS